MRHQSWIAMLGLLSVSHGAHANGGDAVGVQPAATESKVEARPHIPVRGSWYGYQTLLGDLASLSTVGTAVFIHDVEVFKWGLLSYLVTSPVIHAFQWNGRGALTSLGLRAGLPFSGGVAGGATGMLLLFFVPNGEEHVTEVLGYGTLVGLGLGVVAAMAWDASQLAYEPLPEPKVGVLPWFEHGSLGLAVHGQY